MTEHEKGRRGRDEIASWSYMAQQHYRNGRLNQAKEECRRILAKEQRADAILMLGMIAHEQKDLEAAGQHYEDFLRLEPDQTSDEFRKRQCNPNGAMTRTRSDAFLADLRNQGLIVGNGNVP